MELAKYEGHTVVVEATNQKIFRGKVTDYLCAEFGETDVDSIVVRDVNSGQLIEMTEAEIKTIDIIK